MEFLNQTLFKVGDSVITFWSLIVFAFVLTIFIIFSIAFKKFLNRKVFPKYNLEPGVSRAFSKIIFYVLVLTGFLFALNSAGINISIIFAGGAAIMVGIGFGIQNIVNNFISGIIILFERPIKPGDYIEVGGILGTVKTISARSTKVLANNNVMIIVPNSKFLENNVINWSYVDNTAISVPVNVSYDADIDKITSVLLRIADSHPKILKDPAPGVSVSDLTESYIRLKLGFMIQENQLHGLIQSELNRKILEEFKKGGIKFPAPQKEVVVIR